jgi:hypothetical protein
MFVFLITHEQSIPLVISDHHPEIILVAALFKKLFFSVTYEWAK